VKNNLHIYFITMLFYFISAVCLNKISGATTGTSVPHFFRASVVRVWPI